MCACPTLYRSNRLSTHLQLCYLSLKNILVELAPDEHGRAKKCFMCNIWDVQLDSYLGASPFKIALHPAGTRADDAKRYCSDFKYQNCFFGVKAELSEHPTNWIFDLLTITLAPMRVRLDLRLVEFLQSLFTTYTEAESVRLDDRHDPFSSERCLNEAMAEPAGQEGLRALAQMRYSASWNFDPTSAEAVADVLRVANKPTTYVYFKVFKISEIRATVSIRKGVLDSSDVPIKSYPLPLVRQSFQGTSELLGLLRDYYSKDISRQKPRLFGSLAALGNVPGLIQNVTTGGRNFFVGIGNGFKQVTAARLLVFLSSCMATG